jgi:hypothetical protein
MLKDKNPVINKIMFFNIKTFTIAWILVMIWVVVFIFIIWPNIVADASDLSKAQIHYMQETNIGTLGGILIIVLVGVIGKLIYKNMTIKCKKCNHISRADKWYCGNCGEKLSGDLMKKS